MKKMIASAIFAFPMLLFAQLPEIVWTKSFGGTSNDYARHTIEASDGNLVSCGIIQSSNSGIVPYGQTDLWLFKIDLDGNMLWQKHFGGSLSEWAGLVIETADNGYLITGNTQSSDHDFPANQGEYDLFVVKTGQNGNIQWAKTYGGSLQDGGNKAIQLADGNYLVMAGSNSVNGDFPDNHGMGDAWILKLDPAGNIIWQQSYGSTNTDGLAVDCRTTADGGLIAIGQTNGNDIDVTGISSMLFPETKNSKPNSSNNNVH